ncbi:hypothetical protein ACK341_00005, partial [Aeromonas veronii]
MISSNECNDFQPHHIAQTGSLVGRKSRRFEYLGCMIVQFRFYFLLLYPLHLLYGDGIHLTVAHKREWSYGFKPDNKT